MLDYTSCRRPSKLHCDYYCWQRPTRKILEMCCKVAWVKYNILSCVLVTKEYYVFVWNAKRTLWEWRFFIWKTLTEDVSLSPFCSFQAVFRRRTEYQAESSSNGHRAVGLFNHHYDEHLVSQSNYMISTASSSWIDKSLSSSLLAFRVHAD